MSRANRRFKWAPVVIVDGVDISEKVINQVVVTYDEDAATIARFTYIPDDGLIDLLSLVGLSVTIDHFEVGPLSNPDQPWVQRRYTGEISRPVYKPMEGQIEVECTNNLQGEFESDSRANIDIVVQGEYSPRIFKDDADNWQYALDRMSTRPASMWIDANGALQITDWAAKATPDITLIHEDIKPDSIAIESASKRELINRILIALDFRYWNLRQRELTVTWFAPANFCDYLTKGFNLPSKEMFLSAVKGTGWNIKTYGWTELPETGYFYCPIDPLLWVKIPDAKRKCIGANFTVDRRWGQQVTETYQIDVKSAQSIAVSGELAVSEAYGIDAEYDVSDWESPREHEGRHVNAQLHTGGSGDWSAEADPDARAEMEQAQTTVLAKAATEVLSTHRQTRYTFECALHPFMDLSKTVRVTYQPTQGPEQFKHKVTGKVARLEEILDVASGSAVSRVTLAVSMHGGIGTDPNTPLDPVPQPTPTAETPFDPSINLGFRLGPYMEPGGSLSVPNLGDDDFNGYTTNEARALDAGEEYYDEGLTVIIPEIEEAAITSQVLVAPQIFTVDVPQDEFEIHK